MGEGRYDDGQLEDKHRQIEVDVDSNLVSHEGSRDRQSFGMGPTKLECHNTISTPSTIPRRQQHEPEVKRRGL